MKKIILVLVVVCAFIIGWYSNESKSNNNKPIKNIEVADDNPNKDKEKDEKNNEQEQKDSDKEQQANETEEKNKSSKSSKRISICYECAEDKEIEYEFGDGRGLCISCFNTCSMCEAIIKGNEGHIVKPYAKVCNSCYEKIDYCDACGICINPDYETVHKDSTGTYCENCYNNLYYENDADESVSYFCKYCDNPVYSYDAHYTHLGSELCEDCYNMAIYIEDDLGE